jgi:hypothetical protein
MCTGIAISIGEFPASLAADVRLADRLYKRETREEYQFHWWQSPSVLPVQWNGRVQLIQWGSKSRKSPLPFGPWISQAQIELGLFQNIHAEDVVIPANLGQHRGTWFLVIEGIRGLLIRDRVAGPVIYMVVEPSRNYYRNMTEQEPMMPALIGQTI